MKDLFDFCKFGDLNLNSRIVRTGLWESEREQSGNLTPEIYNRYENVDTYAEENCRYHKKVTRLNTIKAINIK